MDNRTMDRLREQLIKEDPVFRNLAMEHKKYEERLEELTHLSYPSEDEQLEETLLKKKKLALKDQMYEIMLSREASVH
ncbi:MAG: DUF465 domain-containing protein [Acidobacteriota bacterium]|nr:DUF465 domain-containing protein [Acidobacteriota bacterium]